MRKAIRRLKMFTKPYGWILVVVLAVAAVFGWVGYLSNPDSDSDTLIQQEISDQEEQYAQLQNFYDELKEERDSLSQEVLALQTLYDDLSIQSSSTVENQQALIEERDQLAASVENLTLQVAEVIAKSDQENQALQTLTGERDRLAAEVADLTAQIAVTSGLNKKTMHALTEERNQLAMLVEELNNQIKYSNQKVEELSNQVQLAFVPKPGSQPSAESAESSTVVPTQEETQQNLAVSNPSNVELSQRLQEVLQERREAIEQVEKSDAMVTELTDQNSMLAVSLREREQESAESMLALQAAQADLETARNQLQNAQEKFENQIKDMDVATSRVAYLETRLKYASKHLRRLRLSRRSDEGKTEQLVESIDEITSIVEEKQTEIDTLKSELAIITIASDILFDSGSATLKLEGADTLREVVGRLNEYPTRIVSVEGHTDNVPIASRLAQQFPSNWELSSARASTAARHLVSQGISADRIRVVGFGELRPIASNDTDDDRSINRRIEIHLYPNLLEAVSN